MRIAIVLGVLLLAGCADSTNPPVTTGASGSTSNGGTLDALPAPNWTVAQWWTLASDQLGAPFTHVVTADGGPDWLVGTDNPEVAFFDARYDISLLGPVRKSDLAGSQGQERVAFFQFPLTAGKNWTTRWDGLDVRIHVLGIDADRAKLEARLDNGTLHAAYTYDATLGYFRDYRFYEPDGATVSFAAAVTASGTGYAGPIATWDLESVIETQGPFNSGQTVSFEVTPAHTDVYIEVDLACTQGGFSISVLPPTGLVDQRGFSANGPCPASLTELGTVPAPPEDEQWTLMTQNLPAATVGTLDMVVYVRTLHLTSPSTTN